MWMDWKEWNVSVGRLIAPIISEHPDALVRFDFNGEGWGFSVTLDDPFADGSVEVYGEGLSPRSALEDAIEKMERIEAAA